YIWGQDRVANPFNFGPKLLSTHTLPCLESTVSAFAGTKTTAFWIDAFCIPTAIKGDQASAKERNATLESMAYIYSKAAQVCVVLERNSYIAFVEVIHAMRERRKAGLASNSVVDPVFLERLKKL